MQRLSINNNERKSTDTKEAYLALCLQSRAKIASGDIPDSPPFLTLYL